MTGAIKFLIKRPAAVLLSFGAVVVLAVLATGLLRFQQDILAILPQHDRAFQVLAHIVRASDGQDKLYFLVKGGSSPENLVRTGDRLADDLDRIRIEGKPAFTSVTSRKAEAIGAEEFEALLTSYLAKPEIFLTAQDRIRLASYLSSPVLLENELKRSLALLATPGAPRLSRLVTLDPFNFRQFFMEKLQAMHSGMAFADGPHMLSPSGKALLLVTTPAFPPNNRAAAGPLLAAIDSLRAAYPEVEIGLTGGYAMAAQEEALLRGDLLSCLIGSALGIGLFFLLAYRRVMVLLFIVLPLGVGLQLALGAMALIWGEVHMLAVAFAAVVLGLGVDFAIHVYDRYTTERLTGSSVGKSAEHAVLRTGTAVLVGGLTTLTAFSVLSLTDSQVLKQIGWLVTLGLLFCLITVVWALPAGLVWLERFKWGKAGRPFHLLGIDRLGGLIQKRPKAALLASVVFLFAALPGIGRITFEQDLMALHPKGLEAVQVRQDIQEHFGNSGKPLLVAWQAKDTASLRRQGGRIDTALASLADRSLLTSWTSITRLTDGNPGRLDGIKPGTVEQVLAKYNLTTTDFKYVQGFLGPTYESRRPPQADGTVLDSLPGPFQRFFLRNAEGIEGISWVYAPDGAIQTVISEMEALDPDILVISPETAVEGLMQTAGSELYATVGWAAALVILILLIFFRSIPKALLALLPTALGLLATVGLMGYLGIKINLINFIIIPILIGIGLDDGIHIIDRHRELGNVAATLTSTGRSIFMTTLTTCLGFGSLALAEYHVLAGMGMLTIIGVTACFFFSTVTLAAILELHDRRKLRSAALLSGQASGGMP